MTAAAFIIAVIVAAMVAQAWFYCRILQKAERPAWWTLSIYVLIPVVIVAAILPPQMSESTLRGLDGALGVVIVIAALVAGMWFVISIWLFAFVRWPAVSRAENNLSWEQLAKDNRLESNRYFELPATVLTSGAKIGCRFLALLLLYGNRLT